MTTSSALRRRARAAVVGLFVLAGALAFGPAVQAHDVLVGSDPEEGAVLDEVPESIVLSFNNEPLDVGSAITVVDAEGATVAEGEGTVEGTDVVLPVDDLPSGELEVRWRVASSDGHPIEGVIPFTLDAPAPEPAAEEPTTEPAEDAATVEPAPQTEPAQATEPPAPATDEASAESGLAGLPTVLQVLLGLAVLGAVAGLIVLVVKRLRSERQ